MVTVQRTVLPNGVVIEQSYSRNPIAVRGGNQRANSGADPFGNFNSIFGNGGFLSSFFGDDDFFGSRNTRNVVQSNTQTREHQDARQIARQRQANNVLQPSDPFSSMMEMFGVGDHPNLNSNRGNQGNNRMIGRTPNGGVLIISSNSDDDFHQHQAFMRNHRADIGNADFIGALLSALMGGGLGAGRPDTRAMSRNELSHLKVTKYVKKPKRGDLEDEQCPICCMELENGIDVKILPCKHTFHPGCIDTWLVQNCVCPICKRDVKDLLEGGDGNRDE